jgi:hypothetical protein
MNFAKKKILIFGIMTTISLFFTACQIEDTDEPANADENTSVIASKKSSPDIPFSKPITIYTLKRTPVTAYQGSCNCHAWAWQTATGVPDYYSIPSYSIDIPNLMYEDGSYRLIARSTIYDAIPRNVSIGDKVVYAKSVGDDAYGEHSAIVESINPPVFRSYDVYDAKGVVSKSPNFFYDQLNPNGSGVSYKRYGIYLRYFRVAKSSYFTGKPAQKIALLAYRNSQYVCVDLNYGIYAPLYSNRQEIGEWETFDLVDNGDGTYALWSYANGRFVRASGTDRAAADMTAISDWCKFKIYYWSIGSNGLHYFSLQSVKNDNYMHYDSFVAGCKGYGPGSVYHIVILE